LGKTSFNWDHTKTASKVFKLLRLCSSTSISFKEIDIFGRLITLLVIAYWPYFHCACT